MEPLDLKRLLEIGDRMAHELLYREHPWLLQSWWDARGGREYCTVCNPDHWGELDPNAVQQVREALRGHRPA